MVLLCIPIFSMNANFISMIKTNYNYKTIIIEYNLLINQVYHTKETVFEVFFVAVLAGDTFSDPFLICLKLLFLFSFESGPNLPLYEEYISTEKLAF